MICVNACNQLESLIFDAAFRKAAGHPDYEYVRQRVLLQVDGVVFNRLRNELTSALRWENQ